MHGPGEVFTPPRLRRQGRRRQGRRKTSRLTRGNPDVARARALARCDSQLQGTHPEGRDQMTRRPHLANEYTAVVFRHRISRRLAEGTLAGMALEGLTPPTSPTSSRGSRPDQR